MHAEENPQRVTKASLSFDIWPLGGLGVGRVLDWSEHLCVGLGGSQVVGGSSLLNCGLTVLLTMFLVQKGKSGSPQILVDCAR